MQNIHDLLELRYNKRAMPNLKSPMQSFHQISGLTQLQVIAVGLKYTDMLNILTELSSLASHYRL